jgi:N-succinyldiaminopimelate aminotransferase
MANPVFDQISTSIFEEMSLLAREHSAINLGQGFPDDPGPEGVRHRAAEAVLDGYNQYPPMMGLPELRQAAADHYGRRQGLDLDWRREVMVTSGATEALASTFLALLQPGDEVIVFQPAYDAYLPLIRRAGGVPRLVSLKPPHWRFDRAMLEEAFNERTRLVVLNNPVNPTAVVLPPEDLALLAEFCVRHDVTAVCDEVWEEVLLGGAAFHSMLGVPGMRERAVKIGSAGKIFGLTGWKVGFICAAQALLSVISRAHQYVTFTTPPNLQTAVAWGLSNDADWFERMPREMQRSHDRLAAGLKAEGFAVLPSQGSYFLNIDLPGSGIAEDDRAFCLRAVKEHGIAAIPVSAFYETDPATTTVRLCFAKKDETLDEGVRRLAKARGG